MRRTKEDSEQTREDILNASVRIFSEKGVSQATLDEIAKAKELRPRHCVNSYLGIGIMMAQNDE